MTYCSAAFYPPIKYKQMSMLACDVCKPKCDGPLTLKRTRPCFLDPCYGDLSCQYASRNLPKWGLPAFVPAISKGTPLHRSYFETFNPRPESFVSYLDQNTPPFTMIDSFLVPEIVRAPKRHRKWHPRYQVPKNQFPPIKPEPFVPRPAIQAPVGPAAMPPKEEFIAVVTPNTGRENFIYPQNDAPAPKYSSPKIIPEPAKIIPVENLIEVKKAEVEKRLALNGYYSLGQAEAPPCDQGGIIGKILGTGEKKTPKEIITALILGALIGYYYGNK